MPAIAGEAGAGAGYPQWFYNTTTHTVSKVSSATTKTIAETVSWPAKLVFFTSEAAADSYMNSQGGGGDISRSGVVNAVNKTTDTTKTAASDLINWPQLTNLRDLMVRVAKVVGGLILVMAGLNMLAKDEAHIDVIGSVKSAAKIGAIA